MKIHIIQNATNKREIEEMRVRAGIDEEVCQWCDIRGESVCWLECMPSKRFKFLKPRIVMPWEGVELPIYFLYWANEHPMKIRALVYLMMYYMIERMGKIEMDVIELKHNERSERYAVELTEEACSALD